MSPDDRPVRLRHLQLGGETLRSDGFLGVILASFILFPEELADVLAGVLVDTMEGTLWLGGVGEERGVVSTQHLKRQKVRFNWH